MCVWQYGYMVYVFQTFCVVVLIIESVWWMINREQDASTRETVVWWMNLCRAILPNVPGQKYDIFCLEMATKPTTMTWEKSHRHTITAALTAATTKTYSRTVGSWMECQSHGFNDCICDGYRDWGCIPQCYALRGLSLRISTQSIHNETPKQRQYCDSLTLILNSVDSIGIAAESYFPLLCLPCLILSIVFFVHSKCVMC